MLHQVRVTHPESRTDLERQVDLWVASGCWGKVFDVMSNLVLGRSTRWAAFLEFVRQYRPHLLSEQVCWNILQSFDVLLGEGDERGGHHYAELAYSVWGHLQHLLGVVSLPSSALRIYLQAPTDCGVVLSGEAWKLEHVPDHWIQCAALSVEALNFVRYEDACWAREGSEAVLGRRLQNRPFSAMNTWEVLGLDQGEKYPSHESLRFLLTMAYVDGYLMRSLLDAAPNQHSRELLLAELDSRIYCPHTRHAVRTHAKPRPPGSFIVLV